MLGWEPDILILYVVLIPSIFEQRAIIALALSCRLSKLELCAESEFQAVMEP